MPFDATHNVVYGVDAGNVEMWSRGVLCNYIKGKLNDSSGPYYATLGLTPERLAVVTDNGAVASAMYSAPLSPPVVSLMQEPSDGEIYVTVIDGQEQDGTRTNIQLTLDMGIRDAQPDDDNPVLEARDDSLLAGFVSRIVRIGYDELSALGLFNINIKPNAEKQRAGQGRYPHDVTFFVRALDEWEPTP